MCTCLLLFPGMSNMVSYHTHRLQHALTQKMDAFGYREKAPPNVQEEDMRKLAALLEQLEIINEAEKKLEVKTGSSN
jgi:valyl-tRNA synthetase